MPASRQKTRGRVPEVSLGAVFLYDLFVMGSGFAESLMYAIPVFALLGNLLNIITTVILVYTFASMLGWKLWQRGYFLTVVMGALYPMSSAVFPMTTFAYLIEKNVLRRRR